VSTLQGWLFGDWPLKLAALGLAVVLYAGLTISEATRSWDAPVPIEVLGAPDGGALLEIPGVVDHIEFQAPSEVAEQLTNDSFRASIDLSGVEPRPGAEPVSVPVDVYPVDPRVRVLGYSPPGVAVRLDEVVARARPVIVDPGAVPEGIELGPLVAEPNQVTIRGASSRLQNVRSVEGRFVIDASGLNIDQDVALEAFDELGALVPGIDIDPPSVRVRADVARQLAYVTVPVLPTIVGQPAHGERIDTVSVAPTTVTIGGESTAVRELDSVSTAPVDVDGLDEELMAEVALELPPEVTVQGDPTVRVVVTVREAEGSRAFEVATAITDARPGLTYSLDVPSVTVRLAGPVSMLDGVDAADLVAEVPVGDLEVGQNAVVPIIHAPAGLGVLEVQPETVRVTADAPA
jgi:YbbR domain-containing protein